MNREKLIHVPNGWTMLLVESGVFLGGIGLMVLFILSAVRAGRYGDLPNFWYLAGSLLVLGLGAFLCWGHFTLQPNEARVLLLFGAYKGTVRDAGFHWTNPLYTKTRLSVRSRNLNGEKLKVNDKRGNPIEIAAVVVWKVEDTAQASFDVEDFEEYVTIQSESAVRHLANSYAYDHGEQDEMTLRSDVEKVSADRESYPYGAALLPIRNAAIFQGL